MPTQVYFCETDGEFDIQQSFAEEVRKTIKCVTCGKTSKHVLYAPAGIKIERTWNEKANDIRRDPYTQAKAQAENNYHEQKDLGIELPKSNEEQIQAAAKAIATPTKKVPEYKRGQLGKPKST